MYETVYKDYKLNYLPAILVLRGHFLQTLTQTIQNAFSKDEGEHYLNDYLVTLLVREFFIKYCIIPSSGGVRPQATWAATLGVVEKSFMDCSYKAGLRHGPILTLPLFPPFSF